LFSLKEILVNETQSNSELILQVFWGLLACQILNGKGRDVVENTSVKKMRDLIERRYQEESITETQFTQYMCWLLHWLLVYSFTQGPKGLENTALFATVLSNPAHGTSLLHVIQMRSPVLLRYMVASFLLARKVDSKYEVSKDVLERVALPVALESLRNGGTDIFAQFLQAIFEEYDIERALKLVETISKDTKENLLMKTLAAEITKQAFLIAFKVKGKLFRSIEA